MNNTWNSIYVNCVCCNNCYCLSRKNRIKQRINDLQVQLQNVQQKISWQNSICQQLSILPKGSKINILLQGNKIENVQFFSIDLHTGILKLYDTKTHTIFILNCSNIQAINVL